MDSIHRIVATIQADATSALDILTRSIQTGQINSDDLFAREMIILYIVIAVITSLIVSRSVRSLLYRVVDTLFAIVLLGLISLIVVGIPFGTCYIYSNDLMGADGVPMVLQ